MKERLVGLLKTYFLLVCVLVLQKPLFMSFYHELYEGYSYSDWFRVMWHGLPVDLSLAGYLTVFPGFLYIVSAWTLSTQLHRIWCSYFLFLSILFSSIVVLDLTSYEHLGQRLDIASLSRIFSSPQNTVGNNKIWFMILGVGSILLYAALLYGIFYAVLLKKTSLLRMKLPYQRLTVSGQLLLATCILVFLMYGGMQKFGRNADAIRFSREQSLNQAAISPLFNLMDFTSRVGD